MLNGEQSSLKQLLAGVPQGSILGPLLFLIYINDLPDEVKANIRLYADNATIFIDFQDPDMAAEALEEDLRKVQSWATRWLMVFNPAKTESLTFSRKRETIIPEIFMGNMAVKETEVHKHLGLILQ